jgi:hypothetical protein
MSLNHVVRNRPSPAMHQKYRIHPHKSFSSKEKRPNSLAGQ